MAVEWVRCSLNNRCYFIFLAFGFSKQNSSARVHELLASSTNDGTNVPARSSMVRDGRGPWLGNYPARASPALTPPGPQPSNTWWTKFNSSSLIESLSLSLSSSLLLFAVIIGKVGNNSGDNPRKLCLGVRFSGGRGCRILGNSLDAGFRERFYHDLHESDTEDIATPR